MIQESFSFLSADKKTNIHAVAWRGNDAPPVAVLQIAHGMHEYIGRYREFAEFLVGRGFLVVGHDHLGHGESVTSPAEYGFFAERHPGSVLIRDMHRLRTIMQRQNRGVPYFMLGHSMGSYLLRRYITHYAKGLAGAVIVGTGSMPDMTMKAGMRLCAFLGKAFGWHYKSPLVKKLSFLGPYRRYDTTGKVLEKNWLTGDLKLAKAYYRDPKCRFDFTVNGYYGLMETVYYDNQKKYMEQIEKDLPLFFVSGDKDPVGDLGEGVKRAYRRYQAAGLLDLTLKLYKGDRHEVLNERNRRDVYEDIATWLCEIIKNIA